MDITYTYEVLTVSLGTVIKRIDALGNISFIPEDENNSDYQAYLASLETKTK